MTSSPSWERNEYLLGGRRVLISDLLEAGLLDRGTILEFSQPRIGRSHIAEVVEEGRLQLADGRIVKSPSRAAAMAAGGGSFDGWHSWRVQRTDQSLDDLRQQLLDAAIESDTAVPNGSSSTSTRQVFLKQTRERVMAGEPVEISVRELISWWDAKGRGQVISEHIDAELDNYGLATHPNFLKVGLDSHISIVAQVDEIVELTDELAVLDEDDSNPPFDVGITLGNIPSANGGVLSVAPQDTFDVAITKMLLNDYSQLAVMSGPRSLKGAVTWQSIARERHANGDANLNEAVVDADVLPYDRELIDVLPILQERDFVFVKDGTNLVTGIVTTADVVYAYGQLATPFFLIGELDQLLRRVISENFTLDVVKQLCEGEGRVLSTFDDLTMGDYQRVLENPGNWRTLHWPLDRTVFNTRLAEMRAVRNDIMHFNPDPIPEGVVDQLRNVIRVIRKYG
jgi:predicted transcriptional regulator